MRNLIIISASVLALAACGKGEQTADEGAAAQTEVASSEMPQLIGRNLKVKPGLWESEVKDGEEVTRSQYCVGADGIPLSESGGEESSTCKPDIKTSPGQVTMISDCTQSGVNVKMEMRYRTSQTKTDGDLTMTVTTPDGKTDSSTMAMTGRWIGACPADLPVGEMRLVGDDEQ